MTAEAATETIIELVYHSAVISEDPWVQETHVETSIRDILEEFALGVEDAKEVVDYSGELKRATDEIKDLESDNEVLGVKLCSAKSEVLYLEMEISALKFRLSTAEELAAA